MTFRRRLSKWPPCYLHLPTHVDRLTTDHFDCRRFGVQSEWNAWSRHCNCHHFCLFQSAYPRRNRYVDGSGFDVIEFEFCQLAHPSEGGVGGGLNVKVFSVRWRKTRRKNWSLHIHLFFLCGVDTRITKDSICFRDTSTEIEVAP